MRTDLLFAVPSLLFGLARTHDIAGAFDAYNQSPSGAIADRRALLGDWSMVGQDLRASIQRFDEEEEDLCAATP
jgi:hypothetical protein